MAHAELVERVLHLRGVPFLTSLTSAELAPLARAMTPRSFAPGEALVLADQHHHVVYMLVEGAVSVRRRGVELRRLEAPIGIGLLTLLSRVPSAVDVVADTHVDVFSVPDEMMYELLEDHFPALIEALRWLCKRLVEERRSYEGLPASRRREVLAASAWHELPAIDQMLVLRRTAGLEDASVGAMLRLLRSARQVRVARDEALWSPGDHASEIAVLASGRLELQRDGGIVVGTVEPGHTVGVAEAIAGVARWSHLVAREPSVLIVGSREALVDMLEDDFDVARHFLARMARALLGAWERSAIVPT